MADWKVGEMVAMVGWMAGVRVASSDGPLVADLATLLVAWLGGNENITYYYHYFVILRVLYHLRGCLDGCTVGRSVGWRVGLRNGWAVGCLLGSFMG